jgi:hypothetical protein
MLAIHTTAIATPTAAPAKPVSLTPEPTREQVIPIPLIPGPGPTYTPTFLPTPTPTSIPTITPTPVPCNLAGFVTDVTIPDGTLVSPGSTFTKTWRMRNLGSCAWSADYQLVFVSGDQLNGPTHLPLGKSAAPGQTIDISVELTAPEAPGTYKGVYKLADASGSIFGIGPGGNNAFFVVIQQGTAHSEGTAQVRLSSTMLPPGNDVIVHVSGFPANSDIDYQIGKMGADPSVVYDGIVGPDGSATRTITIPAAAKVGEYWIVRVITTSLREVTRASSDSIYLSNPIYTNDIQVGLSTTQAKPGTQVIVYVKGFPAYAEIDLRVRKQGSSTSVIYAGSVSANGSTIETITIPTGAAVGEYWEVEVTTTNLQNKISVTSRAISIAQ